jgi:hypothetical protein
MSGFSNEIIASIINAGATILIGLIVAYVSYKYNRNSSKMEDDRLSKELFTEFNKRYDKINHSLHKIEKECKDLKDLGKNPKLESKLNDFFNLCAEEYYWYKKGRIDEFIWNAWSDGMNDWYNGVEIIKDAWDVEIEKRGCKSYYIKNKNDFFKKI